MHRIQIFVQSIASDLADRLTYEARFIRAYLYFEMVKRYGGVPLITVPQELTRRPVCKTYIYQRLFRFYYQRIKSMCRRSAGLFLR